MKARFAVSHSIMVVMALIASGADSGDPDPNTPVRIMKPGIYYEQRVKVPERDGWWGLHQTAAGLELAEFPLSVSYRDAPEDKVSIQLPATTITTGDDKSVLFLVHGLASPEPGPVETCLYEPQGRFLYPGEELYLKLESGEIVFLYATGLASTRDVPDYVIIYDYALHIQQHRPGPSYKIYSAEIVMPGGPPHLFWSGDMNRDQHIDFYFDLTTSESGHDYTLFLSTPSGSTPVESVATWKVPGC